MFCITDDNFIGVVGCVFMFIILSTQKEKSLKKNARNQKKQQYKTIERMKNMRNIATASE